MVSTSTRNDVWQGLLDIARYVRYYDALRVRQKRCQIVLTGLLGLSATSALATLIEYVPDIVVALAGATIGSAVVLNFILRPQEKAEKLHHAVLDLNHLQEELRKLWSDINAERIEDREAASQLVNLTHKIIEVTGKLDFSVDNKLNQRCTETAYAVEVDRYAG